MYSHMHIHKTYMTQVMLSLKAQGCDSGKDNFIPSLPTKFFCDLR